MADLSLEMPVHTKDLRYDKRVLAACGENIAQCLQYLMQQVQNGVVKNEPDDLYDAIIHKLQRTSY